MLGRLLSEMIKAKKHIASLNEVEFKVFSQFGDDGIIQWIVSNLEFPNKTFVEFGVENYQKSNTRFLMMNNNWSEKNFIKATWICRPTALANFSGVGIRECWF
jgi:hypothetical protein